MDVENFLKEKAILFEKLGKSRTFFIFDEESNQFNILAYFSLALQVLKIPNELLSGRKTKNLDGFSSKYKGKKITDFPAILIGQLGKNEPYSGLVTGYELLQYCISTILIGQTKLSGRIIMLECKNIPHLLKLYKDFGFSLIEKDYSKGELLQMIKVLNENELMES